MIKIDGKIIDLSKFPDGTLLVKYNPQTTYSSTKVPVIEWIYENDGELFAVICLKRQLDQYYSTINLSMPYIPHARMDRVKRDEDVFTLKYFCEVINSLRFGKVFVKDAHSNVSLALLDNVKDIGIQGEINYLYDTLHKPTLFYPDEGAMKRYDTTKPFAFGIKNRDWATGSITSYTISNSGYIYDSDVLIIDDICSKGGTFFHAAKALKEAGAKDIYLFVTHLEATVLEGDMIKSGLIKKIYTAETIAITFKSNDIIEIIK